MDAHKYRDQIISLRSPPGVPKLILESSDGVRFSISVPVAKYSGTLKHMLEATGQEEGAFIPLPKVRSNILLQVFAYVDHHKDDPPKPIRLSVNNYGNIDETSPWDIEFLKVGKNIVFDLMMAASYLDVKPLMELLCKRVEQMMKGRTTEQLGKLFQIKNDFSKEEREKQNAWRYNSDDEEIF